MKSLLDLLQIIYATHTHTLIQRMKVRKREKEIHKREITHALNLLHYNLRNISVEARNRLPSDLYGCSF